MPTKSACCPSANWQHHFTTSAYRGRAHHYLQQLSDGRVVSIAHRSTSDGGWLISCEDVTEQQRAQSQIDFMARHDAPVGSSF
ncbi:PAS-domain containing protein [Bradyrhizobium sp. 17]|uniref:PAS-domain containing protein n=1 Tax=Bradyrhizobium sp. 17 TaxID=2782649 RepID=UPI001FF8E072|nr:PAS-domain containing protein [Bradyrhizobium sp. 17]MCK1521822.1 PAS-domain containing protein [Bradyrhizobium sp. 17]